MSDAQDRDQLDALFGARGAVIVPDVVTAERAAELRARLERVGYARYGLVDRGSYELCEPPGVEPALSAMFAALAARATGRTVAVCELRALRLRAGDYLLAHHDPPRDGNPVEIALDLSAAPTPGAELHYRHRGQVSLRVPSAPGTAAVVERGPTVSCNHVYVSQRYPDAEIVRVIALLR